MNDPRGQNEVLGRFLGQYVSVLAGFVYCDRELLYLVADGGACAGSRY